MMITIVFAVAVAILTGSMWFTLLTVQTRKISKVISTAICGAIIIFAFGCVGKPHVEYQNGEILRYQGNTCKIELADGKIVEAYNIELKNEGLSGVKIVTRPMMYGATSSTSYTAIIVPKTE